jgi:hypothetical protein
MRRILQRQKSKIENLESEIWEFQARQTGVFLRIGDSEMPDFR